MKIYTKTGDQGKTSLFGGTRVDKFNIRIEAYGTVDELNSYIGLIRDQKIDQKTYNSLIKIQNDLFTLGAMLATPPEKEKLKSGADRLKIPKISKNDIEFLETSIDSMNKNLPEMTSFILPGGHTIASFCHISRSVCRRTERIIVQLHHIEPVNNNILIYINRLSDYLFVLARKLTKDNKAEDIQWISK